MKQPLVGRSSLFLLELTLDLFIFLLCGAVCTGLLFHAHRMRTESTQLTQAVLAAQTAAECWMAGDPIPPQTAELETTLTEAAGDGITDACIEVKDPQGNILYTLDVSRWEEVAQP